ncbi:sulfatase-like hydrolase/transferase [Azomonas macrocytogenes]|uniref:Sulfatase N-terminal domain-containing protein n=1 Tax=Azomonas macrocytogenes TaxID=69962 RepID=A0A839T346_AZOMA|nr:sulfatase-like hydrolase/transferase [Azomonas macrocytogenes]MBB3102784.1 hypothetical protein [Azomonas macrocytogenes]
MNLPQLSAAAMVLLFASAIAICSTVEADTEAKPKRVVVVQFDGLHYQAPEKLGLTNVLELKKEGTSVDEALAIIPWHPTTGEYGRHYLSSLPNPVGMAGTVLLTDKSRMIQQSFGERYTAHIANSRAYDSLNEGFTYSKLDPAMRDEDVIALSKQVIAEYDPTFIRIALQDTNDRGALPVALATPDKPWKNNLYAEGSPFIKEAREADRLLGDLVTYLKVERKWDDTLFVLQAAGASVYGGHPILFEDSARIPLIFHGPGIAKGKTIPYAENIDVTATIVEMMGVDAPNQDDGRGRVLKELAADVQAPETSKYLKRFNAGIRQYQTLAAQMTQLAPKHPRLDIALMQLQNSYNGKRTFYGIEHILDWQKAGSLKNLVENNEKTLECMHGLIAQETAADPKSVAMQEGCW